MGRRKNADFWQSERENKATWMQYMFRLQELSISMFEWKNVPPSIDTRYLELVLFRDGYAVFFYEDDLGYLALPCAIGGKYNVYMIPTDRKAYAPNGFFKTVDETDSVLIYNNMVHTNSALEVENYSRRLYDLDRIIDVNAKAQKTPILLSCDETQRLTLQNLYMKYDGNQPFIFGDKSLTPNTIKAISTGAPYVADKIYTLKTQIWNEALTYLGISNINIQKKERLITDEVTRNQGGTIASRYSRLEMRRQACREINRMFGLNMWCDYREDYQIMSDDDSTYKGSLEDE